MELDCAKLLEAEVFEHLINDVANLLEGKLAGAQVELLGD